MSRPTVLTIAGSDSSGGAGIQGDLKTMLALGVHGTSAVTCVTAQGSLGVRGWWPLPVDVVRAQVRAVLADGVAAVKLGMLGTAEIALAVVEELAGVTVPVVVDPVLAASSGEALADAAALATLRDRVVPRATVVTPNLAEVEALTGVVVRTAADLPEAVRAVLALGPRWALVTGGHLAGEAVDLLGDGEATWSFAAPRLDGPHAHGTGCALASAIACGLALGDDMPTAVRRAKDYVTGALRAGFPAGPGTGPVDHAWRISRG